MGERNPFISLYLALIWQLQENCPVFAPATEKDIEKRLERVQKSSTGIITGLKTLCNEVLHALFNFSKGR